MGKPRTVDWQEDGIHLHPAEKYKLEALRAAAKEKNIKLSKKTEDGKRHTLTKSELIEELINAGETFPDAPEPKPKRPESAYNTFMKNQIARLKGLSENTDYRHTDIFKKAAENWRKDHPVVAKEPKEPKEVKEKKKRGPSAYNEWVAAQIARLKNEEGIADHKQRFKKAAAAYKTRKVASQE